MTDPAAAASLGGILLGGKMRHATICLALLGLSACGSMMDNMRNDLESTETITGPALAQQRLALDGGCLAAVMDGNPLPGLMAATPGARSVQARETGSPTATSAWRIGEENQTYVLMLPDGACSASVSMGDPQRLHDAAVAMIQARAQFKRGAIERSADGLAERTAWCTAGPYPYVVAIYKRTTGSRAAFLANVFKAQGATLSACNP